jgi:hypothetical protein
MFADQHIFKFKSLRIRMNFPIFMLNRMHFGKFHADLHKILADPQTFKFKNMLSAKTSATEIIACAHGWMTG